MRFTPAAKQTHLFLAGAGLGLAMISALAGWHVAAPKGSSVAFVPTASVPSPSHSPRRPVPDSTGVQSAPFATAKPLSVVPLTPSAPTFQPAALPPVAAPRPDVQTASQRLFVQAFSASIPPPEPMDPYLPGHSLAAAGQRVYVEGMQYHQPTNQTALDVAVVPDDQAATSSSRPSSTEGSSPLPERFGRGFSYEEELFRSKWGWESYNATLNTAQEVAASTAKP